jgi:hypothetical protein
MAGGQLPCWARSQPEGNHRCCYATGRAVCQQQASRLLPFCALWTWGTLLLVHLLALTAAAMLFDATHAIRCR